MGADFLEFLTKDEKLGKVPYILIQLKVSVEFCYEIGRLVLNPQISIAPTVTLPL